MPIYKITNTINNDFYIGKTAKAASARLSEHIAEANVGKSQTHLHRAIRKFGGDVFQVSLVEECQIDVLDEREMFHISLMMPSYNMTRGGDGGPTHHLESWKQGMANRRSLAGAGNPAFGKGGMGGKLHSEETRSVMAKKREKYWASLSPEELKSASARVAGANNWMHGKTPLNAVRVVFGGKEYPSLAAASRDTGHSPDFLNKHGTRINE